MTEQYSSPGSARGMPQALKTAHAAINIPEVQEMLYRLSAYQLGIFMPHMHDPKTGEFQPLPDDVMQVESGSEVSFQAREEIENQADRFLPVGWCWRADASIPVTACEMVRGNMGNIEEYAKHKMSDSD